MTAATSIGVVAHYNLLERLDAAGPGDLYRARDTHHGRTVIVRVLPAPAGGQQDVLLEQARMLAPLSHQNVITVFGAGVHERGMYVAFEHVTGRSLRAEMSGRPMNLRRAVELAIEIADGVAQAHALGFLHGGLSPDAIGVTAKGHAKIAAFHLGTRLGFEQGDGEPRLSDYVSPEEARGEPPDERSDVYSIGAVLYDMLAARRPMHRGAAAPSAANPQVPGVLDDIVLTAVAPNPGRRLQTAAELAAALRRVLAVLELPDVPAELAAGTGVAAGRVIRIGLVILAGLAAIAWLMHS